METIDLRRVTEIHFHRSLPQLCVNRGTVGPGTLPAVWHDICVRPMPHANVVMCVQIVVENELQSNPHISHYTNSVKVLGQIVIERKGTAEEFQERGVILQCWA